VGKTTIEGAGRRNVAVDNILIIGLLGTTFLLPTLLGSVAIILALLLSLVAVSRYCIGSMRKGFVWQPTLMALLGVFAILGVVSSFSATSPNDLSFLVSFLGVALPILLYQYLVSLPKPPTIFTIAIYCLLGCLLGALFAHAQRYGLGIGRTVAVTAGSNAVARVAALLGFLALASLSLDPKSKNNLVILAPVAAWTIVMLTGSRGTFLALPIMLSVAVVFAFPKLWSKSKGITLALASTVAVVFILLVAVDPNGFVSRFSHTLSELASGRWPGRSSELRFELLIGAWNAFLQSPLIGHGWAGHWEALMKSHPTPEIFSPVKQYFSYHNDIADFAVAGGVFGLVAYAIIIAAPVVNLVIDPKLRANQRVAYGLILLPVSYFVFGQTDFVFGFDLLTTLYGFALAFILAAANASQQAT